MVLNIDLVSTKAKKSYLLKLPNGKAHHPALEPHAAHGASGAYRDNLNTLHSSVTWTVALPELEPRVASRPHWPPRHLARPHCPPNHLSSPHWPPRHMSRPHWTPAATCHAPTDRPPPPVTPSHAWGPGGAVGSNTLHSSTPWNVALPELEPGVAHRAGGAHHDPQEVERVEPHAAE